MILYPTIEMLGGQCVSLHKGRLDTPVVWDVDPVLTAREFAQHGAEWMQLTDFDGLQGGRDNYDLIIAIIRSAGIPVQLAGGMRGREKIAHWLDMGAGRVVVGTLALHEPDLVAALARRFPDQIVVSVDIRAGRVMSEGWRTPSAIRAEDLIAAFDGVPLAAIKITDIDADMGESDGTLGAISGLAARTRTPVIASGVVRGIDDIARLKYIPNIAGAVVGRALVNRTLTLDAALSAARAEPEPVAPFV
ncbi:HisA/HisF-related TIM barrel protein [Actibacterium ureilyticum]|uniref:1-(5-phosphoribosyl)-5-[(5- phosphoribosylamino)methylideneamino]imidazole-4- carboxamide isomerase n=1 Tax=Actibacterium ureilyticum TaxID=1590614 RepID=UPI000BAB0A7D|nr:1-(5-phosphoribosyl)-5-[(5-phosphoribosylamino)methylideneamino] imidazole-4-carboxamide isomerase [Actibacterium ureilyticum]